jgi:hypothetical protein
VADAVVIIADKPYLSGIPMRCNQCSSDYNGWLLCGVHLGMAAAYMREMRCPACGADSGYLAIRNTPPEATTSTENG